MPSIKNIASFKNFSENNGIYQYFSLFYDIIYRNSTSNFIVKCSCSLCKLRRNEAIWHFCCLHQQIVSVLMSVSMRM